MNASLSHNGSGILDEIPPNGVLRDRRDSYHDLNDPDLDDQFFKFDSESPDDEEIYAETLMEEVKKLQDMYNAVLQEKQNEEAQRIKLNQTKIKLEHQVQQLNEVGGSWAEDGRLGWEKFRTLRTFVGFLTFKKSVPAIHSFAPPHNNTVVFLWSAAGHSLQYAAQCCSRGTMQRCARDLAQHRSRPVCWTTLFIIRRITLFTMYSTTLFTGFAQHCSFVHSLPHDIVHSVQYNIVHEDMFSTKLLLPVYNREQDGCR